MRTRLLCTILAVFLVAGTARANNQFGVYINEVLYNPVGPDGGNQLIELVNTSGSSVDLSNWSLCIQFNYKRFPLGATIPAGGLYVVHINATGSNTATEMYTGPYVNINSAGDGVGLYHTYFSFSTAGNMEDYVEFGSAGQPRENTANTAGIWTAGTYLPLGAEGQSAAWNGSGTLPHPLTDYCYEAPTIGAPNACGGSVSGPLTDLRINEVFVDPIGPNAGLTRVEILNVGPDPVDATGLFAGTDSAYYEVPGPATVPPGGFLVIHLNAVGVDSDTDVFTGSPFPDLAGVGSFYLYADNSNWNDPGTLVDFFEWGGSAQLHEDVAETAGIWTAGAFFPALFEEGTSVQWSGSGTGDSPTDYCADTPTLGAANQCSISGTPTRRPRALLVRQNSPNPFSGSTRIALETPRPLARVEVTVFNLTGGLVRRILEPTSLSGSLDLVWDGRDDAGRNVPAGQYFYVVDTDSGSITRKMTVIR